MTYQGSHQPKLAAINDKRGYSVDPDKAMGEGNGIFSFDRWAVKEYAKKLGIPEKQLVDDLEKVYRLTVTALTGITQFHVVK